MDCQFEDVEPMELVFESVEEALKHHAESFEIMSIDGDSNGMTFTVSLEFLAKKG